MDKNIEQRKFKFNRDSRWTFCLTNQFVLFQTIVWAWNALLLDDDNAPSHKANIVNEFLAKNSMNIIEQPPYSPDMARAEYFLFREFKLRLRDTRFQSIEDTKDNSRQELESIPENALKKCFDDWIIRWHKCIISGRDSFEGDKINLYE